MDHHPINRKRRTQPKHAVSFCVRAHPIINKLAQELETKGSISRTLALQGVDELELFTAHDSSKCICKKAMQVLVQAGNLKKWMKLLFCDHESRFRKFGVPLPIEYVQIKEEISTLINKLQYNFIMSTYKKKYNSSEVPSPKIKLIRKNPKLPIRRSPHSRTLRSSTTFK